MRNKIYIKNEIKDADSRLDAPVIRRAVNTALRCEGAYAPCEVSVLVTDDNGIRALNREFRELDSATDVLSFPLQNFTAGEFRASDGELDRSTGLLPLGDVVLSAERVAAQAAEYGRTRERETAYLTVHSVLHLLGYDHTDEGADKRRMRAREELILAALKIVGE
ncbi:MAG: rRNA maturation RNase YbeY [Oscillospiraceae bacterium]|jgi:probable rRNA maturation factor|nr:rRNA maturation RNase YbeY [Oscillospiraceae bacterium]